MDQDDRPPVSVILPTHEWGPVCEQLATQLTHADELLVVCDHESDPVTDQETPDTVTVLVAGEPEGCSGKANAMAYAMERASHDRFVWTDDDFDRDADWLSRLVAHGQQHGPASVLPVFLGDGWWQLVEPLMAWVKLLPNYLGWGNMGGFAWGGGVTFTRDEVNVDQLVADLRSCLSDDRVLTAHLGDTHLIRSMQATVHVDGEFHSVKERLVRYLRVDHVHDGQWQVFLVTLVLAITGVLFPLGIATVATAMTAGVYAVVGLRRWTFLLVYPALLLAPLGLLFGILRTECEWGGRRYRIHDAYDIEIRADNSDA